MLPHQKEVKGRGCERLQPGINLMGNGNGNRDDKPAAGGKAEELTGKNIITIINSSD